LRPGAVANEEHVKRLQQGVAEWNGWREESSVFVDLVHANLLDANMTGANLNYADLFDADLRDANLTRANLRDANLTGASLTEANLSGTNLTGARLTGAWLTGANLTVARLTRANLTDADLTRANLIHAKLYRTIFGDVDLSGVIGLETCQHLGPSIIDHQTLQKSGRLPLPFLRGVGLPDAFIDYIASLFG
jgi:uncharacterized protein YjbI with pentapeptide repeats